MNATSARFVRVAHVSTRCHPWSDDHENAVNERLGALSGSAIIVGVDHSSSTIGTSDAPVFTYSTLITYRRFEDPEEESDA